MSFHIKVYYSIKDKSQMLSFDVYPFLCVVWKRRNSIHMMKEVYKPVTLDQLKELFEASLQKDDEGKEN